MGTLPLDEEIGNQQLLSGGRGGIRFLRGECPDGLSIRKCPPWKRILVVNTKCAHQAVFLH